MADTARTVLAEIERVGAKIAREWPNGGTAAEHDIKAIGQQVASLLRSHEQVVKALEKPPNLMGLYTKVCNVLDSESNPREQKMAIGALFDEFLAAALASGDPAPAHETDHARVDRNADADR